MLADGRCWSLFEHLEMKNGDGNLLLPVTNLMNLLLSSLVKEASASHRNDTQSTVGDKSSSYRPERNGRNIE